MKHRVFAALAFFVFSITPAWANDFEQAATDMCDRMKMCFKEQMKQEQSLSEDMQNQLISSIESTCESMKVNFQPALTQFNLVEEATSCMRSMANLSCGQLVEQETDTPECQAYDEATDKFQ